MFYKLRDFISRKLYSLAYFIDPVPTLEEVLGEPIDIEHWPDEHVVEFQKSWDEW
mgnify:CR=1 FL=1